ncbi:hypothetical protein [Bacillus pinisoli]|uniref:hypothetical protein n=1 Tax=Bacillus pinisoli TaxID=2901866 RepID=UPI001FF56EC5|nr:hypothetical protein [Bacillus pinisoli]
MSLEWFHRMENAVRISLPDLCESFDEFEILFDTNTTTYNPEFIFSIQTVDDIEDFCIISFDPTNQEFLSFYYHEDLDIQSKVLFRDADEILGYVHATFHEYIGDIDEDDVLEEDVDELDEYLDDEMYEDIADGEEFQSTEYVGDDLDELKETIEWVSNDKHLHIEDEERDQYSIHLRLGRDTETGDGVLYRHTIMKHHEEDIEDEMIFYFKQDEASYIADLFNEFIGDNHISH